MVVQTLGEVPAELRVTPEQDERLAEQARRVAPADVVRLLELIAAALRALKDGADARTQLELALLKAAEPAYDPTVKALLARIERLEARAGAAAARGAAPPRAPSEPATAAGRTRVAVTAQVEDQPPVAAATTLPGAPRAAPEASRRAEEAAAASPSSRRRPTGASVDRRRRRRARRAGPRRARRSSSRSTRSPSCGPPCSSRSRARRRCSPPLLPRRTPAELDDGELTLAWPESAAFLKRKAEDPASKETIAASIRAVTGARCGSPSSCAPTRRSPPAGEPRSARRSWSTASSRSSTPRACPPTEEHLMPQPPNLNKMLEQAQEMMAQQQEAQEKLKSESVEATAGGGMVKVVMTGDLRLETIAIDPDAVDPEDVEMLQDMVIAALNEALRSAEELQQSRSAARCGGGLRPDERARRARGLGGGGAAAPAAAAGRHARRRPNRAARRRRGSLARPAAPAPGHRAGQAARHRQPHRAAAGLPHPARLGARTPTRSRTRSAT